MKWPPKFPGRHFQKEFFLNAMCEFRLRFIWFVPKVRINNIPALVQMMAWRRPGDKPLSEPMMAILLTHICVTQPEWVKSNDCDHDIRYKHCDGDIYPHSSRLLHWQWCIHVTNKSLSIWIKSTGTHSLLSTKTILDRKSASLHEPYKIFMNINSFCTSLFEKSPPPPLNITQMQALGYCNVDDNEAIACNKIRITS